MNLPGERRRDIRFNVNRFMPRLQRPLVYGYTGAGRLGDTPRWIDIALPAPSHERILHLLPYAFGGYDPAQGTLSRVGLDLKAALAENVELVGTINPDFRNIENQILSLDFSRFERLAGESRPFFLEGAQYSGSALFASQRIHDFDVGVNTYGKVNDKTQFGLLDTVQFGQENAFDGGLTYNPDPNDSTRLSLTSLSEAHFDPGSGFSAPLDNQAYLLRYSRQLGPFNLFLRNMGSHDTLLGDGLDNYGSVEYSKPGIDLFGDYTHSAPNFRPRLGFFPEHDYEGPTGGAFFSHPFQKGTILEWDAGLAGVDYTRTDGSDYRRDLDVNASARLREGSAFYVDIDHSRFEGVNDHLTTLRFARPNGDPYRMQTVDFAFGREAEVGYQSLRLGSALRPTRGLQLTMSFQVVNHGDTEEQLIVGANDDLGRNRAVSGRVVYQSGQVNGYAAFRRSGNRGTEYYLIVGDPNAASFQSSVLVKVVVPFDFKL